MIVHDFDEPLFTRKTCLRRALWLIFYALLGWFRWARTKIPEWLMYEKYSQALALAQLDKMLGVPAVFAFNWKIDKAFPTLRAEIEKVGFDVVNHWHCSNPSGGANKWKARGDWVKVDKSKTYLNFDRHYVMGKEKIRPRNGTNVIWHVDHMSYNLRYYLEFLRENGLVTVNE